MRWSLICFRQFGIRRQVAILLPLVLLACTHPQMPEPSQGDVPTRAMVSDVPLIKQNDFYCGPASLAMVFQWSGKDVTQSEIAAQSFTPGAQGTFLADMIGAARRRGMLAVRLSTSAELLDEVAVGHPVIVFQNLSLKLAPQWHYAVVVGYDLERNQVTLHSGEYEQMTMGLGLFLRTWQRGDYWAMVVLPPDQLPASEDQWEILGAAAALEKLGHAGAAATAYAKGGSRWPDNWIWPYGLGNARYQKGDLAGAKRAFEQAARIDPTVPEIQNNLGQVKQELSQTAPAD
ncbi:MAG: PA2778 family cysteine peptidase [Ruegeria sp.]